MVDVRYATEDDMERWDGLVERSPQGTPFHLRDALALLAEHSGTTLHPLIGYKGQEPVGLFPLFEISKGPVTTLFSPPPRLKVSYMGPLLTNFEGMKRRKAEKRHQAFLDGCMELIDAELSPSYVHVRNATRYTDTRTLEWNGFDLRPRYTYVVDLTPGTDALIEEFSSDARRNVRDGHDGRYSIEEGGADAIERIIGQVKARHDEQGESYRVTPEFVTELWRALPEGTVRPYVCTVDGEFAGGMVTLESDDTVYRWQGGAKTDGDLPVNDLVDWRIIRDAVDRDLARYDLVGANNRRISSYKAKFAPHLEPYYEGERTSQVMRFAARLYNRFT